MSVQQQQNTTEKSCKIFAKRYLSVHNGISGFRDQQKQQKRILLLCTTKQEANILQNLCDREDFNLITHVICVFSLPIWGGAKHARSALSMMFAGKTSLFLLLQNWSAKLQAHVPILVQCIGLCISFSIRWATAASSSAGICRLPISKQHTTACTYLTFINHFAAFIPKATHSIYVIFTWTTI